MTLRDFLLHYVTTVAVIAAAIFIQTLGFPPAVSGLIALAMVLACAWLGGIGPTILMSLLVLAITLYNKGRPWTLTAQEIGNFSVFVLVTTAVGLGGEYSRRIRAATRRHARKLQDQARALSLAHIIFCDVENRVTEWNEGARQMFGWTSDEAVGRDLHQLLRTRFSRSPEDIHAELLKIGQWQGEVVQWPKDGAELIVATHWILYRGEKGVPIGIAKIHNDVTGLRRAEEAVRDADRRKDEFLAMLGHELRNPLAPIRMGLELMKLAKDDPGTLEEVRVTMERQTQQLVTLVDDLLDVSRITRGKLEVRKTCVNLKEIIHSAIEAVQPVMDEAQHELCVGAVDSRIHLDADPHRLAQVFSNLLHNAAKFTPKGGRIQLNAAREDGEVVVSVKDAGIGIAPEMMERIFEMFTQVEAHQGIGNGGLGIGLTLVKSLVEMHGGRVEVESEGPKKGSEFKIRLPILSDLPEKAPLSTSRVAKARQGAGRKVLVVDDNVAAVTLLSRVVQSFGNEVRTAYDGEEAIEVAADFRPEVVVMDLGMPKMNGFDAARHIRQQSWGQNMLLVALSGWGQEDDKRKTKEAGFDHHLTKPAEPSELQRLLTQRIRPLTQEA